MFAAGSLRGARRELAVERQPELLVGREREALRHHADDGRRLAVDPDALADDVCGAAEVALPDAVADERDLLGARLVVGRGEVAAHHRRDAEDRAGNFGHVGAGVALRRAVDRDVDGRAVQVGRQQLERLLLRQQLLEVHREDLAVDAEERWRWTDR